MPLHAAQQRHMLIVLQEDGKQPSIVDVDTNENLYQLIKLRHPGTQKACAFLLANQSDLYELRAVSSDKKSLLVNERFYGRVDLVSATRCNPLFLILPYLEAAAAQGQYQPLSQICHDEELADVEKLLQCKGISMVADICEVKAVDDADDSLHAKSFLLSREHLRKWLDSRVESLAAHLLTCTKLAASCGAFQPGFKRQIDDEGERNAEMSRYHAVQIVASYLPPAHGEELRNRFTPAGEEPASNERPSKVLRAVEPTTDYSKNFKMPAAATKSSPGKSKKQLATAAKSSKKITDFFKKN